MHFSDHKSHCPMKYYWKDLIKNLTKYLFGNVSLFIIATFFSTCKVKFLWKMYVDHWKWLSKISVPSNISDNNTGSSNFNCRVSNCGQKTKKYNYIIIFKTLLAVEKRHKYMQVQPWMSLTFNEWDKNEFTLPWRPILSNHNQGKLLWSFYL